MKEAIGSLSRMKRLVLSGLILATTFACHTGFTASPSPPPNFVFLYVDNLGYGDLGCYGNSEVKTPHLDRLAAEGTRCTDFYVVTSTCTASRGAVLTGRHPLRNGLLHQLVVEENWHGIGLPHRERIIPQYLKEAGYATGCFGKWNIGFAPGSRPTERGFDEFLGCRSGNINYFTHTYHGEYDLFRGTELHHMEGYSGDLFAEAASDFIQRQSEAKRPFFVYVPFNSPHYVSSINMAEGEKPQWQAPDRAFAAYGWDPGESEEKRRYLAVVTALDENVGQILAALDTAGQCENTLVVFLSDMGPILRPTHGLGVASAGIYRDGAPSLYEGGIRIPAILRWPGKIPSGKVSNALLSHLDLLPTFLTAAGLPLPENCILDGRDLLPCLTRGVASPHERIFFHYGDAFAVRDGSLKLIRPKAKAPWELYDLAADPSEENDLAAGRSQDVERLASLIESWKEDEKNDASTPMRYLREKTGK